MLASADPRRHRAVVGLGADNSRLRQSRVRAPGAWTTAQAVFRGTLWRRRCGASRRARYAEDDSQVEGVRSAGEGLFQLPALAYPVKGDANFAELGAEPRRTDGDIGLGGAFQDDLVLIDRVGQSSMAVAEAGVDDLLDELIEQAGMAADGQAGVCKSFGVTPDQGRCTDDQ
ncbi:hypothetical protein [Streptomyces sp. Ncost-T10-10d]|uniref:hypothetical protein n=1 Tax=Streptomyces sp. Ncost-T10-10d TaxID=1839774 RepID=UPI00114CDEBB|nr:hypothetical protein [Streptomyces sp. Ncost-T10-10d]